MQIANYQPIGLPSVFLKIFEKVVNTRLVNFLHQHSVISPAQFDFTTERSTTDAIYTVLDQIYAELDAGNSVSGLFFRNFLLCPRKAFDVISHAVLIHKLYQAVVRRLLDYIFEQYVSDQRKTVCLRGHALNTIRSFFPLPSALLQVYLEGRFWARRCS